MSNPLNVDLKGKVVILRRDNWGGAEEDRMFRCEAGVGCEPEKKGQTIQGYFLSGNQHCIVESFEIEKLVN